MAARPEDHVILVDEHDRPLGTLERLAAHTSGSLHRAFSVFVFDAGDRILLQRRAAAKYHSAGLWTNTCCSHPRPGESTVDAAHRRLREEMGIVCTLREVHQFVYRAAFDNGLVEHEFDHVFFGMYEGEPRSDPAEVQDWTWMPIGELVRDVKARPARYTAWVAACIDDIAGVWQRERTRPPESLFQR